MSVSEREVHDALEADREELLCKGNAINTSNHRTATAICSNQLVFVRNNDRRKFDPIFGPEVYKVIDVRGNGVTLLRLLDDRIMRCHLDDVKDATQVVKETEEETCWTDNVPNTPPIQVPQDPQVPPAVGHGPPNVRPQRVQQLPSYLRDGNWVLE